MARRRVHGDTNIIIRYLTNEPPDQAEAVERFLAGLGVDTELYLCDLVVAEAVYVLQSFYRRPRDEIADRLRAFCLLPGVVVEKLAVVSLALSLYADDTVDFTDSYIAADARVNKVREVFTFDKDFALFDWLTPVHE